MRIHLLKVLFIGLFLCLVSAQCFSATDNWTGSTNSDWGTGSNWSTGIVPTSSDNACFGVSLTFTNQPVVAGNYKCKNLIFGTLKATTLTVNATFTLSVTTNITQNFAAGTAGTNNTSPTTLLYTTVLTGAGAIYCSGNLVIGDGTAPANFSANLFQVSSQVSQFTIAGNIQLNACGNGSANDNQNYPAFTIDNHTTILKGQIVTNSTGSPTPDYYYTYNPYVHFFHGLGTVSSNNAYSSTDVANTNATTFELTNANPILGGATAFANSFYIIFDAQGTGGGTVIYNCAGSGPQTVYTANDVPYYNSVYNSLTLNAASTKTPDAGTLSVGYEGGSLNTSGGSVNFNTNNTVVTDNNNCINSTIINLGTGTLTIGGNLTNNAGGTINGSTTAASTNIGLVFTNNSTFTGNAESLTVTGSVSNTGTFTAGSGAISIGSTCTNSGTFTGGSGSVSLTGKFTNTGAVTGPTGVGSSMYFYGGYVGNAGSFTGSSGYIDFDSSYHLAGGSFSAGSGEVEYDNSYTNTGTYTAGSGLAYFAGKTSQTLLDNSSTGGTVFNNVTFYCVATLSVAGAGSFAVSPTGVLTVFDDGSYAAKLTAGDFVVNATASDSYLTLQSNASSSASVAAITGNTSIKGNVNVQRYITGGSGYRGYRLLSSPVHISGAADYSLNYPINNCYVKGSTGTAGGFDATGSPNIYLFRENLVPSNATFTSGNWRGVNAINNAIAYNYSFDSEPSNHYIYPGEGFLFFFRGSRKVSDINTESQTSYVPTADTLTATGLLNQGAVAVRYWYNTSTNLGYTVISSPAPGNGTVRGFNCVGNPYACSIDLNTASTTAGSGITITSDVETNFYELNPLSQNYDVWDVALNTGTGDATQYVMSGQAFIAKADAAGQTITFNESAKNTLASAQNVTPYLFMAKRVDVGTLNKPDNTPVSQLAGNAVAPATAIDVAFLPKNVAAAAVVRKPVLIATPVNQAKNAPLPEGALTPAGALPISVVNHAAMLNSRNGKQFLRLQLKLDDTNKDDILINFNDSANPAYVVNQDAMHRPGNGTVTLSSMSTDNIPLAINQLPWPKLAPAVIPLNVYASANGTYALRLKDTLIIPKPYEVWLMDAYKKDSLDIRNNPQYLFDLSLADTNSYGHNRFSLVVRENAALMVHLLSFTASKATSGSQVTWTTENEADYTGFSVERSIDGGKTFTGLESVTSSSAGKYTYFDNAPVIGANQYRLKLTDLNGTVSYSAVVIVMYANTSNIAVNGLLVYPNPTGGMVNLSIGQAAGQNTGSYRIQIMNGVGTVVKTAVSSQTLWQSDVSALAPGTYFISVVNAADNKMIGKSTFVKL